MLNRLIDPYVYPKEDEKLLEKLVSVSNQIKKNFVE